MEMKKFLIVMPNPHFEKALDGAEKAGKFKKGELNYPRHTVAVVTSVDAKVFLQKEVAQPSCFSSLLDWVDTAEVGEWAIQGEITMARVAPGSSLVGFDKEAV